MQGCFTLYLKFCEGTSVKSYKIQLPVFLFLVLHQFLYQQISFLQLYIISFNIIWKRFSFFVLNFSFLNDLPLPFPQPHPLINGQNLNVTKVFCEFSLKCLLKYFFKNLLTKLCNAFFEGSKYRFSGFLCRGYFKDSYFDTSISSYL